VRLSRVQLYRKKELLQKEAPLVLYGNRLVAGEQEIPFDRITGVTVLGRNKLNVYFDDQLWQMKGQKRFNAMKYMNIVYRYKNIKEGNADGKFLGF